MNLMWAGIEFHIYGAATLMLTVLISEK